MNDLERGVFELGTLVSGLEIALRATLKRLSKEMGPKAATEMPVIRQRYLHDIKNFTPTGPVPDEVMQSAISKLLALVGNAFDTASEP